MRILEDSCEALLARAGIVWDETALAAVTRHLELVREWNGYASLVSVGDVEKLVESHVVDSLSLAPVIRRVCGETGRWMDIGSGGGFPAIPAKVVLPGLALTLVERSVRRVGFLRQVVGALALTETNVVHGEFPVCVRGRRADVLTARAVEKPQRILKAVAPFLVQGSVFLCQSGDPGKVIREKFHVERIDDEWTGPGGRRGELFLVSRMTSPSEAPDHPNVPHGT